MHIQFDLQQPYANKKDLKWRLKEQKERHRRIAKEKTHFVIQSRLNERSQDRRRLLLYAATDAIWHQIVTISPLAISTINVAKTISKYQVRNQAGRIWKTTVIVNLMGTVASLQQIRSDLTRDLRGLTLSIAYNIMGMSDSEVEEAIDSAEIRGKHHQTRLAELQKTEPVRRKHPSDLPRQMPKCQGGSLEGSGSRTVKFHSI
ncbi:hypothetical protein BU16DRAFT_568491 [Lophium mytilinum]|uniref:Uncharacterized protein n=1 Tax=Lophium mytilinum TaxID=390894 RepID=A0A6A6Q7A0_9PEZI|nr:hypothetical protein BU16DRAFT_568491 [Lophium mytilinum]